MYGDVWATWQDTVWVSVVLIGQPKKVKLCMCGYVGYGAEAQGAMPEKG